MNIEKKKKFFQVPSVLDIEPEEADKIIEKTALKIHEMGMEFPALLFGWPIYPLSTIIGQTVFPSAAPVLELFGVDGYKIAGFLRNKENMKKLLNKIDQLYLSRSRARAD